MYDCSTPVSRIRIVRFRMTLTARAVETTWARDKPGSSRRSPLRPLHRQRLTQLIMLACTQAEMTAISIRVGYTISGEPQALPVTIGHALLSSPSLA